MNHLLTKEDEVAIMESNDVLINAKGAEFYRDNNFESAVEYYRLGVAMGNTDSISNLGYCYLYGRSIPKDLSLAIAYFKIATELEHPEAAYKLGDIYGSDKWGVKDKEKSIYYYKLAVEFITGKDLDELESAEAYHQFIDFPSLCFALGRELREGGSLKTNVRLSLHFLQYALAGYREQTFNGFNMYYKAANEVEKLLRDPQYEGLNDEWFLLL